MLQEDHPDVAAKIKPPRQLSACEWNQEAQSEILAAPSSACLFEDMNEA